MSFTFADCVRRVLLHSDTALTAKEVATVLNAGSGKELWSTNELSKILSSLFERSSVVKRNATGLTGKNAAQFAYYIDYAHLTECVLNNIDYRKAKGYPTAVGYLAYAAGLSYSASEVLLDRMVADGLIEQEPTNPGEDCNYARKPVVIELPAIPGPLAVALAELETQAATASAAYDDVAKQHGALTDELANLRAREAELQQRIAEHEAKLEAQDAEVTRLTAAASALRAVITPPVRTVVEDATPAPSNVVAFTTPAARAPINGDPGLAIFDDPHAYPQVQEG